MQSEKDFTEQIAHLDNAIESLKNFDKFKHLFSDDAAEAELAKLRRTLGNIRRDYKLSDIKTVKFPEDGEKPLKQYIGDNPLVKVRPVGDEYGGKTYIGFLLGNLALTTLVRIDGDSIVSEFAMHNPAIYVPELRKVIYGIESWWGEIESEAELRQISDDDIANVWYVKALKQMVETENK